MRFRALLCCTVALAVLSSIAKAADSNENAATPPVEQPPVEQPPKIDPVYFANQVMPWVTKIGCNQVQCHGSQYGKGGLKLSMFGAEPYSDYEAFAKDAEGRRINKIEPAKSLLLMKATGGIPHGGKPPVPLDSAEYKMLLSWIAQGAPWGDEKLPKVVSLKVAPGELVLQKDGTQQLAAAATFSDGTQKDVTSYTEFKSSDGKIVSVDGSGKVKAEGFGQCSVMAAYMRQCDVAMMVVPQSLAADFPQIEPNNKIDELVFANLKKLGIPPSEVCSDEVFLRRVYLDAIGTLPTADEVRAFASDADPQKRSKLIDRLLDREEFADFWALKWGDLLRIKSEFPINLWPRAVVSYYLWVRESIMENKPYDQFARELVTASGSNFRYGASNFCRAVPNKDPQTIAEGAALVFMGVRIACARCHGHPSENWNLDDNLGLGAFFAKVRFKATSEWKEEIVYNFPKTSLRHPVTKTVVQPKFLGGETLDLPPDDDPRVKFAEWLTSPQNPWFGKNIVNRIWFWLLGRGIIHEPDDLRATNPPSNRELLDYLVQELVAHKYDLKHIYRLILNSKTYQLASRPNDGNKNDVAQFSHYLVKRMSAEQILDAISQITENWDTFSSWIPAPQTHLPRGYRAMQLPDANIESAVLELFGRPGRDTPYESERSCELAMRQALYFVNSDQLENKINNSDRVRRLSQAGKSEAELVEEIYLIAVSRVPTDDEKQKMTAYLSSKDKGARQQAVRDVLWAVLNTKEFMFNH